jgi:hypothetical protein
MTKQRPVEAARSDFFPQRSESVLDRVVGDNEIVLFDPRTNKLHSLNPTASLIWRYCDGRHTISMLAALLSQSYAVPADRAESDVGHLIENMRAEGLLA